MIASLTSSCSSQFQSNGIAMADDDKGIQGVLKLCPRFDGRDVASFREYKDKLRVILSFH